jgi:hypothetical protein
MRYRRMKMEERALGFQAQIYNDLEEMPNRITFPDQSNRGKQLAMLLLWKRVEALSKKKYDGLMKLLIDEGLVKDVKVMTTPGVYTIAEANRITVEVNVSNPRREFNLDWFCKELKKKHKVPEAVTRELYEQAKQPGETHNRMITVKEKGVNL